MEYEANAWCTWAAGFARVSNSCGYDDIWAMSAETSLAIIVRDLFTQLSHTEWLNKDHTFNGMTHQMPFPN